MTQPHIAAAQQGNHPIHAGETGKRTIAGNGRDAGAPGEIRCARRIADDFTRLTTAVTPAANR